MTANVRAPASTAAATGSTRLGRYTRRALAGAATAAVALGIMSGPAAADTSTGSTVARVNVTTGIALTGLTSSFLLTGAPGTTATGLAAAQFNVETNNVTGYAVTVEAASPTMLPANTATNGDAIAIGNLSVRAAGSGSYQPLSSTSTDTVHSQSTRSANGGDALSNDYQVHIPVVNTDTYSATLNYIATAL
jgi:hypothetical protein